MREKKATNMYGIEIEIDKNKTSRITGTQQ